MIKQIDHIGIAVKSIDEALTYYTGILGISCVGREKVESQGINVAILPLAGVNIELLEPFTPESPVAKFIEKRGEGIHHIALRSDDIHAELTHAKAKGLRVVHEIPFTGAHGKLAAFLHPSSTHGVLTEFNEV